MARGKNPSFLAFIALVLALFVTFFSTHPAVASANLNCSTGEAVWFYRSCTSGKPGAPATWVVDLNPSVFDKTSLNFQIKNAYPGYQLVCELHFANSGKLPIWVKEVNVYNPNARDLTLSAVLPPGEQKKVLQPCGSKPTWGKDPASLPSNCRSRIKLVLTIGLNVRESSRMEFAVRVQLEEKPGNLR